MGASKQVVALGVLVLLSNLGVTLGTSPPGVSLKSLPRSLVVTGEIDGEPISELNNKMVYLQETLTVTWSLNASFAGQDAAYKQVLVKLCYAPASTQSRKWRAPSDDLPQAKNCQISISAQPYTATGNTSTWQGDMDVPGAFYYVRAFVLNGTTSEGASVGYSSVAFGQNTDSTMATNLITFEAYMGTSLGIYITIAVFSVVAYAVLFGYFFYERKMKKNK